MEFSPLQLQSSPLLPYNCVSYQDGSQKSDYEQGALGHTNVQTTMIYTHVTRKNKLGVKSPLDGLY